MPVRAKRPMILICLLLIVAVLFGAAWYSKRFVRSAAVPLPPADAATLQLAERLKGHVRVLALKIGERNMWHFERLETLRRKILQRAGRLTQPQGALTLTLGANKAVKAEMLGYLGALQTA